MKKTTATLLALAFLLLSGLALAQEAGSLQYLITKPATNPVDNWVGRTNDAELTVASHTEMTGYFALDLWGNNTADIDARFLLHGYSTIAWLSTSETMFNGTVVETVRTDADAMGNRTYTFTIRRNLTYNDGTPITAKDYLFSLLLNASPQIAGLGATTRGLGHFVGYEAYHRGNAERISGIRLLSSYTFSLTVDGAYLPYFYGLTLLEITPYPIHVIAPGCDVLDDGAGAYIGKGASAAAMSAADLGFEPGVFSTEMLAKTLLDPVTGYVSNPRVTSGPYALERYDRGSKTATFVVNKNFQGTYEGQKPYIERLVYRYIANEDMAEALESGKVGLINKAMDGPAVAKMMELTGGRDAKSVYSSYLRTGLAYLAFACEAGVTADVAVRQAVARCVNKETLIDDLKQTQRAMPVHGYYGLGQWVMAFTAGEDRAKGLGAVDTLGELEAMKVPYNLEEAKKLLTRAGWAYDKDGKAFANGVRYKKESNGSLTPLVIKWAKPIDSQETVDIVQAHLEAAFGEVGIGLDVTEMPFVEMLPHFYRTKARTYDMFFLGSNFLNVFDPYYDYHTADAYQGTVNTSGLRDDELMTLAWRMRRTVATEQQEYAHKWLAFQKRWVELMPLVPLYSNIYFDFYTSKLHGYDVMRSRSWALSIPYAWIGEASAEDAEEGGYFVIRNH